MMLVVIFAGHLGWVFQGWVTITQLGQCNICIQMKAEKVKFSLIQHVYNGTIGCSKKDRENYQRKCFQTN